MKGSTRGARHLAESGIWLASQVIVADSEWPRGTLMETALAHWSIAQFDAFVGWYQRLPKAEERAA